MSLENIYRDIDALDDQIIALLAERQRHVRRAVQCSIRTGRALPVEWRAERMNRLHTQALAQDIDPEMVARVYSALIDASCDVEQPELVARPEFASRPVDERRTRVGSSSPFEATIGFSRAIRSGVRVLVSGTGPVWPDRSCIDDAGVQARRCFEIIGQALDEAGAVWSDVVRTRMFVTDLAAGELVGAVHGELFGDVRPAATMVIVAGLLDPRWKVEIEVEAEVPG